MKKIPFGVISLFVLFFVFLTACIVVRDGKTILEAAERVSIAYVLTAILVGLVYAAVKFDSERDAL